MTKLEKQLIALSSLGIWIEQYEDYMDIECSDANKFNFYDELKSHGILLRGRYHLGSIKQIIEDVDFCLSAMGYKTLIETYDTFKVSIMTRIFLSNIDVTGISGKGGISLDSKDLKL